MAQLLDRSPQTRAAILVGGQALNVWAIRFGLRTEASTLSDDIDFFGSRTDALAAQRDWHGKASIAGFDDVTGNAATVVVEIDDESHSIDFLSSIAGVDSEELRRFAVPLTGRGYSFNVMHPLHVLLSQLENVYGSPGRRDEADGEYYAARARLGVAVAAGAIRELLAAARPRDALRFAERVGELARSRAGLKAWLIDGVDVLEAIQTHDQWPRQFVDKRLPQLRERVAATREKRARAARRQKPAQPRRTPRKRS